MRDDEIDDTLKRAAAPPAVDPGVLDRISASLGPSMAPVRPLPAPWVLAAGLTAVCVLIAALGAARLGLAGLQHLSGLQRALIFPALSLFIWMAALVSAGERYPGRPRPIAPHLLLALCSVTLLAIFAILFSDYGTERFVPQGMTCLTAGLLHATPTAFAAWLILRRGFAVDRVAAGVASGTLAGLAGMLMLELHCANFEAPHVMLWHIGVVWVAALAGFVFSKKRWSTR